ncbi:MAG TPA: DUF2959 family protein [Bacteriovoracaceae bacterium]|nr:DUF2959 family protein [Bacteriovoracaceae bacterium]
MRHSIIFIFGLITLLTLGSCARRIKKAVSDAKYSAYEMVGYEKRDVFKKEASNVKEDQEDTGEAFKDALTKLKEIYSFDGGDLEKQHSKLDSSYQEAKEKAASVSGSILKLDQVAQDLFTEWGAEIEEISTADLKSKSQKQLQQTKSKYKTLHGQLKTSEKKIAPVLTKLKDQVLFLKHNLNARAITGLKGESAKIQTDIQTLIGDMNESSRQADEFIKSL